MRNDPLRVAGWCVVIMAAVAFAAAVVDLATDEPVVITTTTTTMRTAVRELPPAPPPLPPVTSTTGDYVGNTNTRNFHRSTCRHASCKNCTVRFATREDALSARFNPGDCCHP